jgi:hypothetical protein
MICLESFQSADDGITCSSGHFLCQNDLPSVGNSSSPLHSYHCVILVILQILILSMCRIAAPSFYTYAYFASFIL